MTGKIKAVAVFRNGKRQGVIIQDDIVNFVSSLFTQPVGSNISLVRVDVEPNLIGAPIKTKEAELTELETSKKIDDLVGKNG